RLIRATAATKTYALPAADGADIDKDEGVILVRWQGNVYAFNLSCPHQRTALRWNEQDKQFQCPKHHSKYDPKGTFITGRATRSMDRLAITRQGANVVVDIDTMYKEDEDTAQWNSAFVKLS
ncbi:MAG TPA: Rieske (2Fe-2S) protein, partial [Gemmatimonadaceae bacterium]|nr:Rieske (2Fe-2S) protein [Gemmatimonadaceae bacterium]